MNTDFGNALAELEREVQHAIFMEQLKHIAVIVGIFALIGMGIWLIWSNNRRK